MKKRKAKPKRQHRLGDLQLRIMQVLWANGVSTVQEVQDALNQDADNQSSEKQSTDKQGTAKQSAKFAYTTIATMLRKMEDRGLVQHDSVGRKFVYEAAVEEREITRSMANDMLERLFEGSLADMVNHMLTTRDVSKDELAELEKLIAQRKKKNA